ncbi:ribonuclease Z [Candidatus Pacearchaeota archaeon]|nr:ribonuclease Z [Candidatus Pacearchaeota archaeon]
MEPITLTFLGTGSAIPTKRRNHSAFLLNYKNENLLFDCGEGTQRQFRYKEISTTKLTRLFITHWHGDHILGIPGLLQTMALNNYQKTFHIYGPRGTEHFMSKMFETFVFWGKIDIKIHEVSPGKVFENEDFTIQAEEMAHGTHCLAYSFIEKEKIRLDKKKLKKFKVPNSPLMKDLQHGKDIKLNGKTIKAKSVIYKQKGRKITIILDTKMNNKASELAKDSDIVIVEASHASELEKEAYEYNHLTSKQAANIAKKAKAKALYLVHLSQRYEHNQQLIEKQAKKVFKNTKVPNDLDVVEI